MDGIDGTKRTFDIFFAGECLAEFTAADVQTGLARLFKITEDAAQQLMDGGRHRIKSNCDKATALKYREAMAAIGAKVEIAAQQDTVASPRPATAPITPEVDTPAAADTATEHGFSLAPVGALLANNHHDDSHIAIAVPDYEVSEAGEVIPNLPDTREKVAPRTDHLHMEPLDPE